jgi:hypothetical protein
MVGQVMTGYVSLDHVPAGLIMLREVRPCSARLDLVRSG